MVLHQREPRERTCTCAVRRAKTRRSPLRSGWRCARSARSLAAHLAGRAPLHEAELSDRLAVPQAQIDVVIEKLVAGRLLLRAVEPPGIGLARAPESVSAAEILAQRLESNAVQASLQP